MIAVNVLLRQWANQHDHLAAFHFREILDLTRFFGVFSNAFQQLTAQFLVGHFTATEAQGDLYLVAVIQEFENVAHLYFIVVVIRVWTELHFFDFDDLLLLTCLSFFLLSLVFELAIVHDLANRRGCIGRDFHQV